MLIDKQVIPVTDLSEWENFMRGDNRTVAKSTYGEVLVSTVFLGFDHNYDPDKGPLLFETMIFGSESLSDLQWRYSTWEEAEQTHKAICKKYFETGNEE